MTIEIVAIGNEILSGFTINSNAAYLSQRLLQEGMATKCHTVLPDNEELLEKGLKEALNRSEVVITTGGLGPTIDDLTRKVVAKLFDSEFYLNDEIANELKQRYGDIPSLIDQATVPKKAIILKNRLGTAPGFVFKNNHSLLIVLPGVPSEMKEMFEKHALSYLKKGSEYKISEKWINLFGILEASVDPFIRELQTKYPDINFGIYPALGTLRIHLTTKMNPSMLEKAETDLKKRFATHVYDSDSGKIEEAVQKGFIDRRLTLSLAESCTGGAIASHLTQIPGASRYFLGSVVAYSNQLKTDLLQVPETLLKEKGAVSKEIVEAMLQGILAKTKSDFGIAVTGIAGPDGGTFEKPVGTIWGAVGGKAKKAFVWQFKAYGNRAMVIEYSVNELLGKLLTYIKEI